MTTPYYTYDERLREVELSAQSNADALEGHEEVCAERYKGIKDSLDKLNRVVSWASTALITGMAALLLKLLFFPGAP